MSYSPASWVLESVVMHDSQNGAAKLNETDRNDSSPNTHCCRRASRIYEKLSYIAEGPRDAPCQLKPCETWHKCS